MDEKTNEVIKEEPVGAAAEAAGQERLKPNHAKLRKALLRAGAAFLAVVALLAVSKFSVFDLIKGAKETDSVQEEELGAFVKRDIFAIIGFYDEEPEASETGEYALVPMNGQFVTVHFTKRYLESAAAIEKDTYDYINGSASGLDKYVVVEGTTETLSEARSAQMYDWFALNMDWMVEAGVIADTDDVAVYLSDAVLEVDTVNSMSEALVFVLTGLAALCLLYLIVELILMATGFYLSKPKKKKADEDAEEKDGNEDASEKADGEDASSEDGEKEEKTSEDGEECINNEENSENKGCSETAGTENLEVEEDKQ